MPEWVFDINFSKLSLQEAVDLLYFNITGDKISVSMLMKCFGVARDHIIKAVSLNVLNNVPKWARPSARRIEKDSFNALILSDKVVLVFIIQVKAISDLRGPEGEKLTQLELSKLFGLSISTVNKYIKLEMGCCPKQSGGQRYLSDGEELTLISELLYDTYNNVTITKADIISKVSKHSLWVS